MLPGTLAVWPAIASAETMPEYSLEEVAKHNSPSDLWVVVDGRVLDMSTFGDKHPGGARALLNLAGRDATEEFIEIHAPVADFVPVLEHFVVGRLAGGADCAPRHHRRPVNNHVPWKNFRATQVDSPFPASRFHGSGLEAFRFEWGIRDRLLAREADGRGVPLPRWGTRQKAKIAPLDDQDRDWLEVGSEDQYVAEMRYREILLSGKDSKPLVFVANDDETCVAGQQEVLDMMLEWLPRHHPDRFVYDASTGIVHTTTPGYMRDFAVDDFAAEPLRLCAMLVQEDLYLLQEDDVNTLTPPAVLTEYHAEDHPSGRHHVFVSGASCFSFDAPDKHNRPMSTIHHNYVPGFWVHLQRGMNRLFANIEPEQRWWRHNYSFESTDSVTHCVGHDKKWSRFVVPAERLPPEGETLGTGRAFNPGVGIDQNAMRKRGVDYVRDKLQLRAEYQTLSRLPRTRQILFTVRTYVDPLVNLEQAPAAAQALGAAARRKYKGMNQYMGIGQDTSQKAILGFLDRITTDAGLEPGPNIPPPWERAAVYDGTSAYEDEAESKAQRAAQASSAAVPPGGGASKL